MLLLPFFFFKQKTAYEMRISDWSSDVCSSDLHDRRPAARADDELAHPVLVGRKAARDTGKLARDLVIFRFLDQLLGDCLRGVAFGRVEQRLRLFGLGDPRRAIKDEGRDRKSTRLNSSH